LFFYENFNFKNKHFFSEYIIFKKINFILKIIQKKIRKLFLYFKIYFQNFILFSKKFKFIFIFYNFKNNFQNFKNIFKILILCGTPCGKNCTVSNCHVAKTMPNQLNSGVRDLFQTILFLQGCISKFYFYRDEIQNWRKLQGRLSYLSLIDITLL